MFNRRSVLRSFAAGSLGALALFASASGYAANKTLKIGVLGVMSGPAASWGLVNRYCAETTAGLINAAGGIDIGGEKYDIEIVAIDRDEKVSVLLVEQNSRMALRISHRAYALATGSVAISGHCAELRDDQRIKQLYLGGEL